MLLLECERACSHQYAKQSCELWDWICLSPAPMQQAASILSRCQKNGEDCWQKKTCIDI